MKTRTTRIKERNLGGRPTLPPYELYGRRDSLLELLASSWSRIGWRLMRARNIKDIQRAFRHLRRETRSHLVAPFFRTSTQKATLAQARATGRLLERSLSHYWKAKKRSDDALEKGIRAGTALMGATAKTREFLLDEVFSRSRDLRIATQLFTSADTDRESLLMTLLDQEAYAGQADLLKFIQNPRCAHNPSNLAGAIAGFPTMGCRRSFLRCSLSPSPLWPHLQYEVFRTMQRCWERSEKNKKSMLKVCQEEICRLPKTTPTMSGPRSTLGITRKGRGNFLRKYLCERWRDLSLAIEGSSIDRLPRSAVPYLICSQFHINLSKPKSAADLILEEREKLETND
jgi:hypothetical protein